MNQNLNNIPAEKFQFASRTDLYHDSKFETKPVSYFQGAFKRFSKNKGAVVGGIVIAVLVLFAIFAPFFTPFQPSYYDMSYAYVTPKLELFANSNINFWDGCRVKNTSKIGYLKDLALATETGREVIKNNDEYGKLVGENTSNWEKERVCVMDMIILKLALTEFCRFPYIPVKVTMNEYIEISKYFSTPKSKIFVNGILDRMSKKLMNENVIVKKGIGLLDS